MRKLPARDQYENADLAVSHGRLSRLLLRLFGKKSSLGKEKQPLAVAHLYGLPRPGAV